MSEEQKRFRSYDTGLTSGLLSVPEVTLAVLGLLSDRTDRAQLWAGAPSSLRQQVLAYLTKIGLDGLPKEVFRLGQNEKAWRVAQAAREREVAAEILAQG